MNEQADEEAIRQKLIDLYQAENDGKRDVADSILAEDYLPITRAKGHVDSSREDTLEKISKTNSARLREVDKNDIDVVLFEGETVAIARTLLTLKLLDQNPPGVEYYRNMHVFLKRGSQWECIAWQVTKVASEVIEPKRAN